MADRVVLTSDNPRSESPQTILDQMLAGLDRPDDARVLSDRREAIRHAVSDAAAADVVLVAGKGHETYQEVLGVRHPFSDVDQVTQALVLRAGVAQGVSA